jgi:demethylmenaquinone methyltransferase / 2-methoxy-6-polyprenyl-1,4-benzoquinol methylase
MAEIRKDKTYGLSLTENNSLFSAIASKYDFVNHLLSLYIDRKWRRELVKWVEVHPGERILDVCTGTGEIAIEFAENSLAGKIVGVDSSEEMLGIARGKIKNKGLENRIELIKGNALELPFEDGSFDVVSIGFGLRNIGDYKKGISEMVRVLKDGGRLLMLEFSPPLDNFFGKVHSFYLNSVIPTIGKILSGSDIAYRYLAESIAGFPQPKEIMQVMQKEDLKNVRCRALIGGIVYSYRGQKQKTKQEEKEVLTQTEKQTFNQNIIQGDLFSNL